MVDIQIVQWKENVVMRARNASTTIRFHVQVARNTPGFTSTTCPLIFTYVAEYCDHNTTTQSNLGWQTKSMYKCVYVYVYVYVYVCLRVCVRVSASLRVSASMSVSASVCVVRL
jgi:hypothetical protein